MSPLPPERFHLKKRKFTTKIPTILPFKNLFFVTQFVAVSEWGVEEGSAFFLLRRMYKISGPWAHVVFAGLAGGVFLLSPLF
jgi:ABC-type Mn2+/Zn2+ transport system permease subunit